MFIQFEFAGLCSAVSSSRVHDKFKTVLSSLHVFFSFQFFLKIVGAVAVTHSYGMLAAFLYGPTDRQTDGQTVADTNKGVVEVQAVRLRTNICVLLARWK